MTQKDRDKRADIAELESYLSGNNNVEAPEKRKEEKDTLWLGVGRDGVVLSDVAKDEAPVQREKKGSKKLLWLLLLIPIILSIVIFSRIQKNNSMVFVEGGIFMMGSDGEHDWENPVHEVTLSSFWISKYEVTQKEWQEVMGSNPSHFKGDNLPVESVSWYDVIEYCNKRSTQEGFQPCYSGSGDNISCNWNANGYRLPTEAEWEYAARGGNKSKSYEYAGSYALGDVAWYDGNSGSKPHPVGQKRPNELGLYDMSGNVWEWCWDWHNESSYDKSSMRDPRGARSAWGKVQRGGSWGDNFIQCRVADRSAIGGASGKFKDRGFRVARANK
ncbi:MAG: formylglycine-generating enzyme family protein [Chloroflexi bacterium]|nr:formylglycine-generating enzyme family protein [Chloroflexota bacterium]